MSRFIAISAVAATALFSAVPAVAATGSVTGRLIDLACYIQAKPRPLCDRMNALEGFEAALLTPDGKVYHLRGGLTADSNSKLLQFMTKTVTVTGDVSEKDGQFQIDSNDIKASN